MGLACFPACGCGGNTYCMGCDVTSNGISILTFSGKAGLLSTREPGCRFTTPACAIATVERHGMYSLWDAVDLTYDDGTTASLQMLTNCTGAGEPVGTDYGAQLTLTPSN
jgi:hypothetical protein